VPENPKLFINNVPVEICTSVQLGLPFVHTLYMELLLKGILAAAQALFPITICHLVIMANHIHILIVVRNPQDVPRFMDYFKSETAHALNRLMGTTGQSFWVSGYDSPPIISANKFLERMEYLYLNPVEASLVPSISKYRGINSYKALLNGGSVESYKKLSRTEFSQLPYGKLSEIYKAELAQSFLEAKGETNELKIEPWAWLSCYDESKEWNLEKVKERFLARLDEAENKIARKNPQILKPERLEDIRAPYRSKRRGKKSICLSDCPKQRSTMIAQFKQLVKLARTSYQLRKQGVHNALPPPGFFLPGGALLANMVLPKVFLF